MLGRRSSRPARKRKTYMGGKVLVDDIHTYLTYPLPLFLFSSIPFVVVVCVLLQQQQQHVSMLIN